jgi:hypothetical protein
VTSRRPKLVPLKLVPRRPAASVRVTRLPAAAWRVARACVQFVFARRVRKEARWRVRGRVQVHSGDVGASVCRNRQRAACGRHVLNPLRALWFGSATLTPIQFRMPCFEIA